MKNVYEILVWKPEGKKLPGRPRHRWEDSVKTDLRELSWEGMDWIHLAEDRVQKWPVVSTVINNQVTYKAGNFLAWVSDC
jgi:hypothetical protein